MVLEVVLVARNKSVVPAVRSTSIVLVPDRNMLPLTVRVPTEAPGETVEPALAVREPIKTPLPLIVWPLPRVNEVVLAWLRSSVPVVRSRRVAGGSELPISTRLPVPCFTILVTVVPLRALSLLMVREVAAIPKVALPVRDTGPLITDVPLSLVIVGRFCIAIILFSGKRLRANRFKMALVRTVMVLVESPSWPVLFWTEKVPCWISISPRAASTFVMETNETWLVPILVMLKGCPPVSREATVPARISQRAEPPKVVL